MKNKLKITFDHRGGTWEYKEHLVYDILDEDGSPLCQAGVYIQDHDGKIGHIEIFGVILKVDIPLPNGVSSVEYVNILSSLEKQGYLKVLPSDIPELEGDYLVVKSPCTCSITSSPLDPEFEENIENLLEEFFADDDLLDKIRSGIKSVCSQAVSTKRQKNGSNSREKSNGGTEDDIT